MILGTRYAAEPHLRAPFARADVALEVTEIGHAQTTCGGPKLT